nr:DNA mismatch repair protein MSH4 [Tanacetum cinerariifolium]
TSQGSIEYGGQSYSEPLGAFTTGHPYIKGWNKDVEGSIEYGGQSYSEPLGAFTTGHPYIKDWNEDVEVGVAAFDLRSTSLYLSKYIETSYTSYQNTKTLLHFFDHNVLIPPSSLLFNDALSHLVDSSVRKIPITCSITYAWSSPLLLSSGLKPTKVTFNGSFDHVTIDATSVLNLDLIDPLHYTLLDTSDKNRSLFQILKTTRTIEGYNDNIQSVHIIIIHYILSGPLSLLLQAKESYQSGRLRH